MSEQKIVFVGPSGAGKTTAIQTITEARAEFNGGSAGDNWVPNNVLFGTADYELLNLASGQALHLLGTQGDESNETVKMIMRRGVSAVVVLISNAVHNPLALLREQLLQLGGLANQTRVVVGITHMDVKSEPGVTIFSRELHKFQVFEGVEQNIPLLVIDPRDRQDMALLIETALYISRHGPERELA